MSKPPTNTERTIIQAAIKRFLRYGARKTSMNDIADEANVSRQTLYDLFGGKDDLICASIRSITDKSLSDIREKTADLIGLGDQLDVYFEDNVVRSFEMMTVSDDPQDLVTGHNEAGKAEIANTRRKHEALISEWLEPYATAIDDCGHSVEALSHYFVTVAMALKYEAKNREDLDELWFCHRAMILRTANCN